MTHKTVIERVTEIEKAFPQLIEAINDHVDRRTIPLTQLLNAVVDLLGRETVGAKMKELREQAIVQEAELKKQQLEVAVAEGRLVKVEKITEGSVIVSKEAGPDGTPIHTGRFQMTFAEVDPKFQEKLLGMSVGTKLDLPNNAGTYEVVEIYELAPVKVPAAIETPAQG